MRKWEIGIKNILKKILDNITRLTITIIILIIIGVIILIISSYTNGPMNNILCGVGTGIITSAIVSYLMESINRVNEKRKMESYYSRVLTPFLVSVGNIYNSLMYHLNEYRILQEKKEYILIPIENTKELSKRLKYLESLDLKDKSSEEREKLEELFNIPMLYYREMYGKYYDLPLDDMLYQELITEEQYSKLKDYGITDECRNCIDKLERDELTDQKGYEIRARLFHGTILQINRMSKILDVVGRKIKSENYKLDNYFDDLYFREVIETSEEFIREMEERAEADAEYYAEHPELLEETERDILEQKILEGIWDEDKEKIKKNFAEIDPKDKGIQNDLTMCIAKKVMKDRELRRLYYEKYGIKYKNQNKNRVLYKMKMLSKKLFKWNA